jgi:hypothetical protein
MSGVEAPGVAFGAAAGNPLLLPLRPRTRAAERIVGKLNPAKHGETVIMFARTKASNTERLPSMQLLAVLLVVLVAGCNNNKDTSNNAQTLETRGVRDSSWEAVHFRGAVAFRAYTKLTASSKVELAFEEAPSFVHALSMAPEHLEPQLKHGKWLVLVYATWSILDVQSIPTAIECISKLDRDIQLGIRPFVSYDEMYSWYPEYDGCAESPYWMFLSDGVLLQMTTGPLDVGQLTKFINIAERR